MLSILIEPENNDTNTGYKLYLKTEQYLSDIPLLDTFLGKTN